MSAQLDHRLLAAARVLFAREQLEIAVRRCASRRVVDVLVTQLCAALEDAQAGDDFEFFPNHRGENRRSSDSAA